MPGRASSASSHKSSASGRHHRRGDRDDHRRRRRRRSSSSSSSERSGGAGDRNGGCAPDVLVSRIGNEQDRDRRLADIEADDGFRQAAFVSTRGGGGGGGGGGVSVGGYAKLVVERGHDSAIFGRPSSLSDAARVAQAEAEAEQQPQPPPPEPTEAARIRELMHPSLAKDLDRAWEDYRARLANLVRLQAA